MMAKNILVTGATDGIGLETAKLLAAGGHALLLHGRNAAKLEAAKETVAAIDGAGPVETCIADLSHLREVAALADRIRRRPVALDVLINNAGIFKTPDPVTPDGLDIRFAVNSLAPYLLARELAPGMGAGARIVNLSSAAQAPVDLQALAGKVRLGDMDAYAQSKLALTMWNAAMAAAKPEGPVMIAVNPGSLLASKMVREGFGVAGKDLSIGASVLVRAALSDSFADATGRYFDNDRGSFGPPHPDASDPRKCAALVAALETILGGALA